MQPSYSNRQSANLGKPLGLAFGLSLLLLPAFLAAQFANFDTVGWSSGFDHPWEGWDHLVTMLAVGIWAAQLRGQAIWMLPLAFVGVMGLGGVAGAEGFSIPHVEGIILLSCAVFGILITRKVRFSTKVNVLIVAFFAFFHGFAHGHEISTSASLISYVLGFMLATLLLHGAGILVAKLLVFAVTCLLTVLFSQVALARNADTSVDVKAKSPAVSLEYKRSSGSGWGLGLANDLYLSLHADGISALPPPEARIPFSSGGGEGGDQIGAAWPPSHSVSELDEGKLVGIGQHLKEAVAGHPLWQHWYAPVHFDDDLTPGVWRFKHYFPNINHTPGSDLLSNGVGLTSPPVVDFALLSPQDFFYFRNNSPRSFEKLHFQSSLTGFDTGDSFTESSGKFRHDGASFHRRRLKQVINLFSLTITGHRYRSSQRSLSLSGFLKIWPIGGQSSASHSIQNNNDITRRNNDESI